MLFSCRNLTFKTDDLTILNDLCLDISEGEHLAITGPSGSGKSSLLRVLLGFVAPTSGEILFKDKPLITKTLPELRNFVGTLFQEPSLTGNTVNDAIFHPFTFQHNRKRIPSEERVLRELKSAGLHNNILDKKIDDISGGEKQRIALIRTILLDRMILVADEPTSALDKDSRNALTKMLLSPRRSAIIVTHDEELAALCDRTVVIENGAVAKEIRNAGN